jgi:hypothetical protein
MNEPGLMTHFVVAMLGGAFAITATTAFAAFLLFRLATRLFNNADHD